MSDAKYIHNFERGTKQVGPCHVCNNLWPSTDGLMSKHLYCGHCDTFVHSSCKGIAEKVICCDKTLIEPLELRIARAKRIISGYIKVSFLRIFDIPLASGTISYSVCRSSITGSEIIINSGPTVANDKGELVWDHLSSSNDPTLDSFQYMRSNIDSFDNDIVVTIEVWKSFMAIFDTKVAECRINVKPLLQLPNIEIERWFPLSSMDGKSFGNVLLKFICYPKMDLEAPKPDSLLNNSTNEISSLSSSNHTRIPAISDDHELNSTQDVSHIDEMSDSDHETPYSSPRSPHEIETQLSDVEQSNDESDIEESFSGWSQHTPQSDISTSSIIIDESIEEAVLSSPSEADRSVLESEFVATFEAIVTTEIKTPSTPTQQLLSLKEPRSKSHSPEIPPRDLFKESTKTYDYVQSYAKTFGSMAYGFVGSILKQSNSPDDSMADISSSYVGFVHVDLSSAFIYDVSDPGDGNYYVSATINDSTQQELRSKPVYNSATPIFNLKWRFTAPYFRSILKINLVDALRNVTRGESSISIYSLVQREADEYYNRDSKTKESSVHIPIRDVNDKQKIIGYFVAKIVFKEDVQGLYLAYNPRIAASGPQEQLSVERLTTHIARFQSIVDQVSNIMVEYKKIVEWDEPFLTLICVTAFVYCCLEINAEYALCCPLFLVILLLTSSMLRRQSGSFKMKFITPNKKEEIKIKTEESYYQPYATVKLAVIGFRRAATSTSIGQGVNGPNNSSFANYFGPNNVLKCNPNSSHSSLSKATIRVSYFAMNSYPFNISNIQSRKSVNDKTVQNDLSDPREFFVGCFKTSVQDMKDGSTNLSKLMYSLKKIGVSDLMGGSDEWVKDAGVLHNVFEPWPITAPLKSRSPSIRVEEKTKLESNSLNSLIDLPMMDDFHMKEISLVYPFLQPVIPIEPKTNQMYNNSMLKPDPIYQKLSRDLTNVTTNEESRADGSLGDTLLYADPSISNHTASTDTKSKTFRIVPWNKNESYIKVIVYEDAIGNDSPLGYVRIPIKDLLNSPKNEFVEYSKLPSHVIADKYDVAHTGKQHEIVRWYALIKESHSLNRSGDQNDEIWPIKSLEPKDIRSNDYGYNSNSSTGEDSTIHINLRLQLDIRNTSSTTNMEASRALQHLLFHHSDGNKGNHSTITALWNMRDHITYVQNLMSWILDLIESFKNIFNWTIPSKTYILYVSLIICWIISVIIPGRYIILTVGLHQFFYKFLPDPDGKQLSEKLHNLLQSIPNDDDLHQLYQEERVAYTEDLKNKKQSRLKKATLGLALKFYWEGSVLMKLSSSVMNHLSTVISATPLQSNDWQPFFLVLQSNRLAWWSSDADVIDGRKPCIGQLLLYSSGLSSGGVCGITQTSPVDIKEMKDSKRLIAIFGCDEHGIPSKCTIFFNDVDACQEFHRQISYILQHQE